ncbi:hypothetical protein C8Q75DRAFT_589944 [Abortiporus biennis]|nr:hypothetical protein C8Q75DRAFT_589944 [Abortiporus biennis]
MSVPRTRLNQVSLFVLLMCMVSMSLAAPLWFPSFLHHDESPKDPEPMASIHFQQAPQLKGGIPLYGSFGF